MFHLLKKSSTGFFASQTLTGHLIRGGAAFALLYFAIGQQHVHPFYAVAAGLAALAAMRGCPVCWTIGLLETVQQRISRTTARARAGDRTPGRS
jgi:hypothetical protein